MTNTFFRLFLSLVLVINLTALHSSSEPLSWKIAPSQGFRPTLVGEQSVVQYTITNHSGFVAAFRTEVKTTGGDFTLQDECNGVSIQNEQSCDITIGFKPTDTNESTFQIILGYHNLRIPLPKLSSKGISVSKNVVLSGKIIGLPPTFYLNNAPDFTAVFTNNSDTTLQNCSAEKMPFSLEGTASKNIKITNVTNTCENKTLKAKESCKIHAKLEGAKSSGGLSINGRLNCEKNKLPIIANARSASIIQNQEGCAIHGRPELALPSKTHLNGNYIVKFIFENECTTDLKINKVALSTSGANATLVKSDSLSSCGTILSAGQDCFIVASVTPQALGALKVLATVTAQNKQSFVSYTKTEVVGNSIA